jgi:hypothetical protein
MTSPHLAALHVVQSEEDSGALLTRLDALINWSRKN